ncbi:SDR family oxidoreductase [Candidatus Uhrbacteria bacterium]|nr:SDR family oxidoreductase [Candidatus Uhrbacteria bacterium]
MIDLKGKVIVITGASRGLGRALARVLAQEGAQLVLANRNVEELNEVAQETGGIAVVADVSDEAQVQGLARTTIEKYGRIDIWINNAGIWMPHVPIEELNWKRVHEIFEVNVFGLMYGSKEALVQMKKQQSGTIINIISVRGVDPLPNEAGYTASKFAATGFTKCLRLEAEPFGVRVFGIYPGGMKTHLFDEAPRAEYNEFMDPADVAQKIISHIKDEHADPDLILKRPNT